MMDFLALRDHMVLMEFLDHKDLKALLEKLV
jgi:hypothetical protein